MTANDFIFDSIVRRQIFLQRFANGEAKKAVDVLTNVRDYLTGRIASAGDNTTNLTIMLADIESTLVSLYADLPVEDITEKLALTHGQLIIDVLNEASVDDVLFVIPSNEQLIQAVTGGNVLAPVGVTQITIEDIISDFAEAKANEMMTLINTGMLTGQTNSEIIKSVNDLLSTKQRRNVETIVRTLTNHAANRVQQQIYRNHKPYLDGYEWVSILDARTTLLCAGRDGFTYKMSDNDPVPPAHHGCRSTTVPKLRKQYERPGLSGERIAGKTKTNASTNFDSWLRRQSKDFIIEYLGPNRAKLYIENNLPIDRFRDETGVVYTLDQLENLRGVVLNG